MTALAECRKGRVRRGYVARSASRMALLVGALVAFGVGVAGAAPLGAITEFRRPESGCQSRPGAGGPGRQPVVQRPDRRGRSDHDGRGDHRVQQRPEPGQRAVRSIAMGPDGNMWFSDTRHDEGDRDDQPDDAGDQRVQRAV